MKLPIFNGIDSKNTACQPSKNEKSSIPFWVLSDADSYFKLPPYPLSPTDIGWAVLRLKCHSLRGSVRSAGERQHAISSTLGVFSPSFSASLSVMPVSDHQDESSNGAGLRAMGCERELVGYGDCSHFEIISFEVVSTHRSTALPAARYLDIDG